MLKGVSGGEKMEKVCERVGESHTQGGKRGKREEKKINKKRTEEEEAALAFSVILPMLVGGKGG
jgi:hypothetical protein